MRTFPTTLLQIFCKVIFNFQDNVISIIDPDNNFKRNSSINGLNSMSNKKYLLYDVYNLKIKKDVTGLSVIYAMWSKYVLVVHPANLSVFFSNVYQISVNDFHIGCNWMNV